MSEWRFQLKLNEYLCPNRFGRFSFKLRIPVSESILLPEEVRNIIDTPEFQRLRGIRQLGPTIFVFPGANHTRFEHSLGTYFLSLKYLERLMDVPLFREICESLDEAVKLIVLSSLLHDIGHYPYSHWIEEIGEINAIKFPTHEDRAKQIIKNGCIGRLIEKHWEVNPEDLTNIIAGKPLHRKIELLVNSIINSPIDVDKVDYLIRDSIHCGVNYGKGIDVERLLISLYIDPSTSRICLTDKGRSCLLSILGCRNIMYQEVYWHKTVRACTAMFKRFFYEYVKREIDDLESIKSYFEYPDDEFVNVLFKKSKTYDELSKLITSFAFKGRSLYKPAYIFSKSNLSEEPYNTREFFIKILEKSSYKRLVDISNVLAERLQRLIKGLEPHDILIDTTPIKAEREIYKLDGFKIWNIRKERFETYPREVNALNEYLRNNMQAYIFCNPKYYRDIKELALQGKLDKILGEIIDEV